jgi:hypothetical protein
MPVNKFEQLWNHNTVLLFDSHTILSYYMGNILTKPLPQGTRNMVGFLFSAMSISPILHCEILSLPKQSKISLSQTQLVFFQRFALELKNIPPPLQKVKLIYKIMRKISSLDPPFTGMMGISAGRPIGKRWEAGK